MAAMDMDQEQFQKMMEDGGVVLVDFWAPWCSYCRRINAAYERIAAQYADKMVVAKVNIDDESQLAEKEQIEVTPTLVLYRGGEAIGSIVSPESKVMIDAFIQECDICGWEYDEALGYPEGGIAPGTKWADISEDFECPLCSVGKDMFSAE